MRIKKAEQMAGIVRQQLVAFLKGAGFPDAVEVGHELGRSI